MLSALEAALASHRYALTLDRDDADTLFNTAGVLTSMAEEIAKDAKLPGREALPLLEEALELQTKCLARQEYLYTESQQQQRSLLETSNPGYPDSEIHDGPLQPSSTDGAFDTSEEKWAAIVEPVTKDTLIDTIEAQLSTLTTLCSILSSSPGSAPSSTLAWIEDFSSKLLNIKAPVYLEGTTHRAQDIALAKANLVSALLEAGFRSGSLDVQTYKRERNAVFAVPELDLHNSSLALLSNADSLIAFNIALVDTNIADVAQWSSMRWETLSTAIGDLTKASKLADMTAEDLPRTHLLRGDASMLQFQLSKPAVAYPPAISNGSSLLRNAEVFYRNASKLAKDTEQRNEALLKESLALYVRDKTEGMAKLGPLSDIRGSRWTTMQVEDLISEGVLGREDVETLSLTSYEPSDHHD